MENDKLIIICVCIIVCVVIVAGAIIIINNNNQSVTIDDQNSQTNNGNSNGQTTSQGSSSNSIKILSANFYSDGNENTGEDVTVYLGQEFANKKITATVWYYRDGSSLNNPESIQATTDSNGYVLIRDFTPMPEYPDSAHIEIEYNGNMDKADFSLATHSGSQELTP
jgi:phosphatidate phosphatase APP1